MVFVPKKDSNVLASVVRVKFNPDKKKMNKCLVEELIKIIKEFPLLQYVTITQYHEDIIKSKKGKNDVVKMSASEVKKYIGEYSASRKR